MTARLTLALVAMSVATGCTSEPNGSWLPVRSGDLVLGVEVTGMLHSVNSVPIKPPAVDRWNFKISELADEGADVAVGDVVVAFDASELMQEMQGRQNDVASAEAEIQKHQADSALAKRNQALAVAEAEAKLRKARLKVERPSDLAPARELEQAELDRQLAEMELEHARAVQKQAERDAAARLSSLQATLASYQGRLRDVQESIGRMRVTAPVAGTVVYPDDRGGEKKKVGDQVWRLETVLEVAQLGDMIAKGYVDEVDSSRVAEGQPASFRLDAHPDTEIRGVVSRVARVVQRKSESDPSRIVHIEIAVDDDSDVPLRPGMRLRGRVETGRVEDAVLIPVEALFVTDKGPVAYRRNGDDWQQVALEIGKRNSDSVEVVSGLEPGDEVSTTDMSRGEP